MAQQQTMTQAEYDKLKMGFDVSRNYINPAQSEAFEKDVQFYLSAPIVEAKTPKQIDAEAARSLSATTAIIAKHVDKIAETLQKATDLAEALNGKTITFQ